ncbi:MAG: glutamyl-tRNA reductase [Methanobrevibacter sp.]|uniref:glutamyl-tRNA reductase n=1 Tax=Methanobrevibacter sp. TaxID=66852 RepID=UPI0026DFCEC5|nr:glutamyl-tRNA reductase [Methanobrevibacter sp.]MDO5848204.1 glutamyl-tRNA reductase [Methanobrevibacter sp.]
MIINIRVDYTVADIETMEHVSKQIDEIFERLKEKYSIDEYIEISTCNRKEYYIHNDNCVIDEPLLDHENKSIIIEHGDVAINHLFRMASGLESMIVGEDQILGQIKDSLNIAKKERHCGKILDTIFTKAIHVGQVVRNKTNINKGSVSIGSVAVDLAEKHFETLENKVVLVIGAGKMGSLVAKSLAEKNLEAIFVANRTYYTAVQLAKDLNGEAIFFDDLNKYLKTADVVISATGAPHPIITKKRLLEIGNDFEGLFMVDIANPRDISSDVEDLGVNLCNIDDLRELAEFNKNQRKSESIEAEIIIGEEFDLLKESFKIMEIDDILGHLRSSMEDIRQRETQKAIVKLSDVDGSVKILDNLTKSIVNKIFYDINKNLKEAAKNDEEKVIEMAEYIFK